jgi:membrane-associated phospholipid phosphatase
VTAWLESLDAAAFRFTNQTLANPVGDAVMPWFAGHPLFLPAVLLAAAWLVWKGGVRGRVCVVLCVVLFASGNAVIDLLKDTFARARPFVDLPDARVLVGKGGSGSLPSAHAGNWFLAVGVLWHYYRRSLWVVLPLALLVALSRVYTGVHYPGDVLAGALVGGVIGWGGVWLLEALWRGFGRRWFPLWWRQLPSLRAPVFHADPLAWQADAPVVREPARVADRQWLRLGYLLLGAMLVFRLGYLASDTIELSEDEAYQWLWSKHPALSYYSKPPMIAYLQWIGTHVWGDTELGVRFLSPVIAALIGVILLRFFAAHVNARAGFWLVTMLNVTPLTSVGAILLTIDPPLVLFWTAAMTMGWRALQANGRTRDWAWTGLWMGLGFLSKYTALLQWISFALVFALWLAARRHLRRPGPYVALAINLLCTLPVLVWNAQHDWITVTHLGERAGLAEAWRFSPRFFFEFTGAVLGLLNPVFFIAALWAAVGIWRRRQAHPLWLYLLLMAAPVLLGHWVYTVRARVLPNWIATAVVPLFAATVAYADARWRGGLRGVKPALATGCALGLLLVLPMYESNWVSKLTGRPLPPKLDPLRRVRNWSDTARVVGEERARLAAEGPPAFLIGNHYGITGQLSFYLPEAKAAVQAGRTFVYFKSSETPGNQFYFWPGYRDRKGENAVFVMPTDKLKPPPPRLVDEFTSVTDLGLFPIRDGNRVMRQVQLFACRGLR